MRASSDKEAWYFVCELWDHRPSANCGCLLCVWSVAVGISSPNSSKRFEKVRKGSCTVSKIILKSAGIKIRTTLNIFLACTSVQRYCFNEKIEKIEPLILVWTPTSISNSSRYRMGPFCVCALQGCIAISRDSFMNSIVAQAQPMLLSSLLNKPAIVQLDSRDLSFDEAVAVIKKETPPSYIDAVRLAGGRFLYRGESIQTCSFMSPEPDLLRFDTYSDEIALDYFKRLEECINKLDGGRNEIVRPSNGHIATATYSEAAKWGTPVSIWPIGSKLSFAYPKDRELFYDGTTAPTSRRGWNEDLIIDDNLKEALVLGKEVMFGTTKSGSFHSSFVAVPSHFDERLQSILF